ncbi:MAG: beta-ketoacyl synthase N-terminal-like domain-containing protein [Verrucomicrobiales bacterium]|nr:hypothetical protein [Verrucomicrobiales bacterium]
MVHPVSITAAAVISGLGVTCEEHTQALLRRETALKLLGQLPGSPPSFSHLPAAWIADRALLKGRRSGAASNLLVRAAQACVERAGWSSRDLRETWIYAGTSRANQGEWRNPIPFRRALRQFAASNSLHSEIAAAVSLVLGIRGPWQVLSNGCASGLDALGHAWLALAAGLTDRVLVLSVDLPLSTDMLEDFADSGMLSAVGKNDPYATTADGFLPGEAAVALCLERSDLAGARQLARILTYRANSDALDLIRLPEDGGPLADLLTSVHQDLKTSGISTGPNLPALICPHASGTKANADSECRGIEQALDAFAAETPEPIPVAVFKPQTGHALGASGLLEVALLLPFLSKGHCPPQLEGLSEPPSPRLRLCHATDPLGSGQVWKIASGMGGHNAVAVLDFPGD